MQRKALQVQVELDIHAVTCPGVFLCPNGKVSLQLYMLDSCIQTVCCAPTFPILCHEKFIFYKMFYNAQRLSELQRLLNKECLYMELIQWQNTDVGNVLATFQTNLSELLYPSTYESSVAGVDIDLLMEPERSFPGVIAPKVEVSTKTIIEDTVLDANKTGAFVVNPKVIQSKSVAQRTKPIHLRKVCHSSGYHRTRKCTTKTCSKRQGRPPFVFKKVDDNLLARKPEGWASYKGRCRCFSPDGQSGQNGVYYDQNFESMEKLPQIRTINCKTKNKKAKNCLCGAGHEDHCPVCSKYKYYFEDGSPVTTQYPTSGANRKPCVLQRDGKTCKKCTCCQELGNTKTSRVIRCTSAKGESPTKSCLCTPKLATLATKLHRRLNQTLDGSCDCECAESNSYADTEIECVCPDLNMGDFYKNFYRKAKSKIQCDKYITPCCI